MKKLISLLFFMVIAVAAYSQQAVRVSVVYFHAAHRCPTCISIEENTKKTLNKYFATQVKDGTINLRVLDVSAPENEKLVVKYEADGSGLYITRIEGKKEKTTNFTNFAFSYSRNQADKFILGLKAEIEKNLK